MNRHKLFTRPGRQALLALLILAACLMLLPGSLPAREDSSKLLLIGTSESLSAGETPAAAQAGLKMLTTFIKYETGRDNKILAQKNWRILARKLEDGKLELGVFPGDEFAWAKKKYPRLHALALGINGERYPVAFVVTRKDSKAGGFTDLRKQDVALSRTAPSFVHAFLRKQCGTRPDSYFSKIKIRDTAEDALDDVFDGKVGAAVVERASLLEYRHRKPGRFRQVKEVARSKPFPPMVVAYHSDNLDEASLRQFRKGLVAAVRKERGRMMLTLFRLSRFEPVPTDFTKVLTTTQISYPPPPADTEER
jgi:ABC-type phosphate/phosphonate transport system substrate-binding protein